MIDQGKSIVEMIATGASSDEITAALKYRGEQTNRAQQSSLQYPPPQPDKLCETRKAWLLDGQSIRGRETCCSRRNHGNLPAHEVLLIANSVVSGEHQIKRRFLRHFQQIAVVQPIPSPAGCGKTPVFNEKRNPHYAERKANYSQSAS